MALNHAFLITAHAYPEQLKDIVGLLSAPNHYFFINIDRKAKWGHKFMDENRSAHIHFWRVMSKWKYPMEDIVK